MIDFNKCAFTFMNILGKFLDLFLEALWVWLFLTSSHGRGYRTDCESRHYGDPRQRWSQACQGSISSRPRVGEGAGECHSCSGNKLLLLLPDSITETDSCLMKEQIEDLTSLLDEIDRQPPASLSTTISTSLLRAKLTLEQLDQIVKIKLLRNTDGGSRARHRAWVRNKSKVCKIQKALKEHRLNLVAAMGVTNL